MASTQGDRMRRITGLAQRLLTDLAREGYGETTDLGYLSPGCAARVRGTLDGSLGPDWRVEADYGETVLGTAYLPETGGGVRVELLMEERSVGRDRQGRPVPLAPTRWLLVLELDAECQRIISLRVSAA